MKFTNSIYLPNGESKSTDLEEIQKQMNLLKRQIAELVKTEN